MGRECDDKLYVNLTALNNHVRNNHTETRILNNLQLVEHALFHDLDGSYVSHWPEALIFLRELKHKPPPFRQALTTKIRWRLEQHVNDTFLSVVELNNEALKPAQYHPYREHLISTHGPFSNCKSYLNNLYLHRSLHHHASKTKASTQSSIQDYADSNKGKFKSYMKKHTEYNRKPQKNKPPNRYIFKKQPSQQQM